MKTDDGWTRLAKTITDRRAALIDTAVSMGYPLKVARDLFKDWEPVENEQATRSPSSAAPSGEGVVD